MSEHWYVQFCLSSSGIGIAVLVVLAMAYVFIAVDEMRMMPKLMLCLIASLILGGVLPMVLPCIVVPVWAFYDEWKQRRSGDE